MKNILILFFAMLLLGSSAMAQYTDWNEEGFENETRTLNIQGSVVSEFGLWVDGGSDAYVKNNEYAYDGAQSFVITGNGDPEKPFYSSIYTKQLDMSGSSSVAINFKYFVKSKSGYVVGDFLGTQNFYLEVSNDGGSTFTQVHEFQAETDFAFIIDPYDFCPSWDIFGACEWVIDQFKDDFWQSEEVAIPSSINLTDAMVFRLKSDFDVTIGGVAFDGIEVYLDDITIKYSGGEPAINELRPINQFSSLSPKTLYNTEDFTTESNASWGIWNDGGGDAYQTGSYPDLSDDEYAELASQLADGTDKNDIESLYESYESGDSCIAIRDYYDYVWLEDADDEYSGEKYTYSSIFTDNLDFSAYEALEVHFSFVARDLETDPEPDIDKNGAADDSGDGFSLSISRDAGISYTTIKTWYVGVDFSNDTRYRDVSVVIKNSDFEDWTGTEYDFDGFTTTTILKFTSESDDDTDIVYLDNISIYTAGDSGFDPGQETTYDWSTLDYSILNSDGGSTGTYELINKVFHPEGYTDYETVEGLDGIIGAVEHSDCSHVGEYSGLPQGITEELDDDLGVYVFSFNMDLEADTDRCKDTDIYPYKSAGVMGGSGEVPDRQRVEIKTYSRSDDYQIGEPGETHIYAWRFKLPSDFAATDRFSHLHQLKSKGAVTDEEGKPLITLTAGGPKTNQEEIDAGETDEAFKITTASQMRLRYSPAAESQINLAVVDLEPFLGKWVQCVEKITVGEWNGAGRYELLITDYETGAEIMAFKSYTLRMDKTEAEFIRAKWGLYRSLIEAEKMKDEQVKFSDVLVMEVNDPNASISDFSTWYETIQGEVTVGQQELEESVKGGASQDLVILNAEETSNRDSGIRIQTLSGSTRKDWNISAYPGGDKLVFGLWETTGTTTGYEVGRSLMEIDKDGEISMSGLSVGTELLLDETTATVDGPVYILEEGGTPSITNLSSASNLEDYHLLVEKGIVSSDYAYAEASEWKDEVFEKGYNLQSLESVDAYIRENGKLPEMPSEEEVVGSIYDLHEMRLKFLTKIEELALYILENEKLINELEELLDNKNNESNKQTLDTSIK